MSSFFRISAPAREKVPQAEVDAVYKRLRSRTFWGSAIAYSLFYICRMAFSVVKQPMIDSGVMTVSQLGLVGSCLLFVYAIGKFVNGFIADYCNIRRFMATGLVVSALVNLLLGVLGLLSGPGAAISTGMLFILAAILWGINGWAQSMGAPPGVIGVSRWFPLKSRGTWYSIFCATPYLGKFLSLVIIGFVVSALGWQYGFLVAAAGGLIGAVVILLFVSDTPESKGLPSVQELSGEDPLKTDSMPVRTLHMMVLKHPGVWIIAISSAFVYITQFGLSNWGVLLLQKSKGFSLADSAVIIGFSEAFGIAGTVFAGYLSDKLFKGDRVKPVALCGAVCFISLGLFLFTGGNFIVNVVYISVFSLSIGVLYCIVAGLMALDIVPRKATGAALGIVGISSYLAAGMQDIVSALLIQSNAVETAGAVSAYDFTPVAIFWLSSCLVSFILPIVFWKSMKKSIIA